MAKGELSTGDYIFLAFLMSGPKSAYDLKKEMGSSASFFWSAQHSQVYQQAQRLQRDGFIQARGAVSERNRQPLALTAEGKRALKQWLREPAGHYRIYDESLAKVFFANLAGAEATLDMLADQQRRHRELLQEFEEFQQALSAVELEDVVPGELYSLRLGIAVENAYLKWIGQTLSELRRKISDPRG